MHPGVEVCSPFGDLFPFSPFFPKVDDLGIGVAEKVTELGSRSANTEN